MRDSSFRFNLPYIMPGQAQKHVTYNEAIRALDTLIQANVLARSVDSPDPAPAEGDGYIVSPTPSGDFAAYANHIAKFIDGAWMFYPPVTGQIVSVQQDDSLVIWRGAEWTQINTHEGLLPEALSVQRLGIAAQADEVNRLSLNAQASLFNHDGAGHQLKINKSQTAETASVLFQNGFSARAEMGIIGEDNFSFKVSEDGT